MIYENGQTYPSQLTGGGGFGGPSMTQGLQRERESGAQQLAIRLAALEQATAEIVKLAGMIEERIVGPVPQGVAAGIGNPDHSAGLLGQTASRVYGNATALEYARQALQRVLNEL